MFSFQYEIDINEFKKSISNQSSSSNNVNPQNYPAVSSYQNLWVFDFDSTLFRSPLPNPKLWSSKLIGKLISDCCWFYDERTLCAPYIPSVPSNEWWNSDLVRKVEEALQEPNNLVILLTGRNRGKFGNRIKELCRIKQDPALPFHFVFCKEITSLEEVEIKKAYASTFDFKTGVLAELLEQFPSISRIVMFDDRENHIKLFKEKLEAWKDLDKIKSFEMNLVSDLDLTMPQDLESTLVLDLIKSHNDRIIACMEKPELPVEFTKLAIEATSCENAKAKRKTISAFQNTIEVIDEIEFCAIFLDQNSKERLQNNFSQPCGWKVKCDHMTISFGKINESLVAEIGGLGTKHTMTATHFGIYNDNCMAVKLDAAGLKSENETIHITLYISQSGNARQSNLITEWKSLPEPITLNGILDVKKVIGMKSALPPAIIKNEVSIGQLVMKHHPHLKGKEIGMMVDFVKRWMLQQFVVNLDENQANIEYFVSTADFSRVVAKNNDD